MTKVKKTPKQKKTATKLKQPKNPEIEIVDIPAVPVVRDAQDRNIRDAQYRKGLSIAFFNATNAAVEATKQSGKTFPTLEDYLAEIVKIRNFFIEEHKNYYSAVVAQAGTNYSVEEAVKKLRACKNLEALHVVWLEFSEDERRDMEIARVAQEVKKKYENA
jgi:hypothetical protein